jgi:enterobacteria phage integrase
MDVGRPKSNDYPPYMTVDGDLGRFVVRNPITGKKKRFSDEAEARAAAVKLGEWVEQERKAEAFDAGRPTIQSLVKWWKRDRLQFQAWDINTRKAMVHKMDRIGRELGDRVIARTDSLFLEDWLTSFCNTADHFNKWRYALVLLWKFALSRHLVQACEPEKIERRSTSKKLEINRKVRQQLDIEGFKAIRAKAEPWLQLAMDQSLVTLQARAEICAMQHAHYRGGYLFVIRDKVSGDSDMAFIKIALTAELEEIRKRSRTLDNTVSPYLIHRAPERRRREWTNGKPHWTFVNPEYLSKAFAEARDAAEVYKALKPRERPTFHEIRGLGARILRAQGVSEAAIQGLMTHSNKRTTQIYLDRGAAALTDNDYHAVTAPLSLSEILGTNGTN